MNSTKVGLLAMGRVDEAFCCEVCQPISQLSLDQLETRTYARFVDVFMGDMYDLLMDHTRAEVLDEAQTQVKNLRLST